MFTSANTNWIGPLGGTVTIPAPLPLPELQHNKKGKPMDDYYDQPTVENRRLTYAQNRIQEIFYEKNVELRKQFHVDNDDAPRTGKELVKRIEDKRFVLKTDEELQGHVFWSIVDYFIWRDPDAKIDLEGYDIASEDLKAAKSSASDAVTLSVNEDALKAIETFSNWTYKKSKK
jgi:hypothetical protein